MGFMSIILILKFLLIFNKLVVPQKLENNISYIENSTIPQQQLLETTTISNYDYYDDYGDFPFLISNISGYACENNICVIKCCPEGQLFVVNPPEDQEPGCNDVSLYETQDWKPEYLNDYVLVYGLPPKFTDPSFTCTNYKRNEFYLNDDDGTVYLYAQGTSFSLDSYCIDSLLENGKIEESAVICYEVDESNYMKVTDDLHTAAIAMSTVSLFIVVLIYIFTPHKLDLQKRCTLACCINLFIGFLILLINKTPIIKTINTSGCITLGILTQYFFLSFYFWLNTTCFEIFRIIRGTFNLQSISDLSQSIRRFIIYCVYCHGCPLFICSVTLAMQMIPLSSFPSSMHIIKPRINEGRCWFEDGESELVYYYIFEISLHVINAFFMGYTTYLLYKEKLIVTFCKKGASTITVRTHSAFNHLDAFKQQMRIYILYIFIWIINSISLIHRRARFWRIVDIIVALQGVFVVLFILHTSKTVLVKPLFEKISNAAREISSRISEKRSLTSSNTETTNEH